MRRWLSLGVMILIPSVYLAAFLGMAWVRSQQGHSREVLPSEIEPLAIHKGPTDPLADARARGRPVYEHYCRICHGADGKGDGFNASNLARPPRDFTEAKFWQQTTDEGVYDAITQGGAAAGKSVLMPAWGHTLSEGQIRDVMVFIRAFALQPKAEAEG